MKKTKLIVSVFVVVLALTSFVAAHTGVDDSAHHYGMMGGFYGWGMWNFMWIICALAVIALVLFIVWLVKQIQEPPRRKR